MKILILADHFGTGGGAGTIARLHAEELSKKHDVHVLAAHLPENHVPYTLYHITRFELDYHLKLRNYLGLYHPKAIRILGAYLSKHHFDLAITHNIFSHWSYAALDILAEHGIKTIHVFHDVSSFTNNTKLTDIRYSKLNNEYTFDYRYSEFRRIREWWGGIYNPVRQSKIKKHLGKATKTVAVSHALADALGQNDIRVDAVVHNGVPIVPTPAPLLEGDFETFPSRGGSRKRRACSNDSILFIGKPMTAKGIFEITDYLAYLKKNYSLAPLLEIAGSRGIGLERMLEVARHKGVDAQIKTHGWLEAHEFQKILSECSIVIVPSICFDSFPTVILESYQCQKPVVATIFGGAKEIVDHGRTGYIEDPFDIPAFSEHIRELLTDTEKSNSFGEAGLKRLQSEFSLEQQTKKLLSLVQ